MAMSEESDPNATSSVSARVSRKDKRKAAKKEKRKQRRKEVAEVERQLEEARLNDPEEQRRVQREMEREKERVEKERREFEERERMFLEALTRKKAEQEEEERRRALLEEEENKLKEHQAGLNLETNEDDEWEYADEVPPEIIWRGNEIIVKKCRVKVKKTSAAQDIVPEDPNRPTSNPLPPQSEAFADYKNASVLSAEELLENVAQQTPNFGTEQDKAHCPFHLKTGACRFGSHCSRVHFYPDKSCTLLMKNMYNGPGLAWEQDEGLEHTDEEVERSYEEFYEDVHTEFLKFGEIINFKVCRNGSYHLRGNVYVHYNSLDSALAAYQSVNGRYFAGKQVTCEFVGVTRWKVAICGEFMRSRLKTCSRGTACNFIHCFRNPGGDYEWADWDKPPPRSWMEKMAALFGYSYESAHDRQTEEGTVGPHRNSSKRSPRDQERYDRLRSHYREIDSSNRRSREHYEEDNPPRIKCKQRYICGDPKNHRRDEFEAQYRHYVGREKRAYHDESRDSDIDENSGKWGKRPRRSQGKILESDNCPDSCSLEGRHLGISTNSPKMGEEKSTHQEFSQKSSRKQEASSGIMDTVGSHKTRSVSDDSSSGWRRTNGNDFTGNLSDEIAQSNHSHRRKSSRHPSEVSRSSNDHIDDYPRNKSETMKLKSVRKTSPHERELHSRKTSETECLDEHLKLYDRHGDRKCKLYHERSKSYDSDISGSHDCRESLEETDVRDRWVPDKVDAVKRHKQRRKSDRGYKKRESKDRESYDSSSECSDACFQDSRSRGGSKSKEGRSSGSCSSSDSKLETSSSHGKRNPQEYGEDGRSHKRKSHHSDGKQESNEPESHGWSFESSDACFKESISRGSSKSKEGRTRAGHSSRNREHNTNSTRIDSERKQKESGEGGRSHKRKKKSSVREE